MTGDQIREHVLQALVSVAPEVDPAAIRADQLLRDQIDLDSMDFLRFIVEVHKTLGVDVPESDYGRFDTLSHAVGYLASRLGQTRA